MILAYQFMHALSKGFGQTVTQGLEQNGRIIIIGVFEGLRAFAFAVACSNRKATNPVVYAFGGHKISQGEIGAAGTLNHLLAQRMESGLTFCPALILPDRNIVSNPVGRPKAYHTLRRDPFFRDHLIQHGARIGVKWLGRLTHNLIFQDCGELAVQFPRCKEGRPIDNGHQVRQRIIVKHLRADKAGLRWRIVGEIQLCRIGTGRSQSRARALILAGKMGKPRTLLIVKCLLDQILAILAQ